MAILSKRLHYAKTAPSHAEVFRHHLKATNVGARNDFREVYRRFGTAASPLTRPAYRLAKIFRVLPPAIVATANL